MSGASTDVLIPLIAVLSLDADTTQVGILAAVTLVTSLIFRYPAGSWADGRQKQIPLQVRTYIVTALLGVTIPILWITDLLTLPVLLIWVAVYTLIQTLSSALGHGVINDLTTQDERVTAVGKLQSLTASSAVVGQAGGPGLTALFAPPFALLMTSLTSCVAAIQISRVQVFEVGSESRPVDEGEKAPANVASIISSLVKDLDVWLMWAVSCVSAFIVPVTLIFFIDGLDIQPALIGILIATGAVGGIAGGLLTGRAYERLGHAMTSALGCILTSIAAVPLLFVTPGTFWAYLSIVWFELGTALGGTLLVGATFGALQMRTKRTEISRTISTASIGLEIFGLAGIALGAAVASAFPATSIFGAFSCAALSLAVIGFISAIMRRRHQ
ncbi:MFS transporter [Pseudarthrobacter sp. J64]|nr:MFS transporter [Pseudarthrobacter sp. J64]